MHSLLWYTTCPSQPRRSMWHWTSPGAPRTAPRVGRPYRIGAVVSYRIP
jgi:hypothetical protein